MQLPKAAWFIDPQDPTQYRWWDGTAWGEQRAPAVADAAPNPTGRGRRRTTGWLVAGIAAAVLLGPGGLGALASATKNEPVSFVAVPAESATPPPPRSTPSTASVDAVATIEVVVESIPFAAVTLEDPAVDVGVTAVTVVGVEGVRTITYDVLKKGETVVSRTVSSDLVTTMPIDQVTTVGTRVPPPPPPPAEAAPACHPSYADVCVPYAADVDCAGGSGNGPAYAAGPLRVVGPDEYDLDRDGDGIACD